MGTTINNNTQMEYIKETVVGQIYKLLPIYEGRDIKTKEIIIEPEEALDNFLKQLIVLETTIKGINSYSDDNKFHELLYLVEGMKYCDIDEQHKVKLCTFRAIELCKDLIKKYGV